MRKRRRQSCCQQYIILILLIISFIFLVAGTAFAVSFKLEEWVKDAIKRKIVLKPGNEVYDKWLRPETPAYLTLNIFNVTNYGEVTSGGIPKLQEHGPYTYREYTERSVVDRDVLADNSLTYKSRSYYVFDKEKSCATCDPNRDKIITINLPFLTMLEGVMKYVQVVKPELSSFVKRVLDDMFKSAGLAAFHVLSVDQLLWGYEDPRLQQVYTLIVRLAKSQFNKTAPFGLPKKFSIQKNNSISFYGILSGEGDYDNVGQYLMWRNATTLPCWNSKYANMINGTDGHRFKPEPSKEDVLRVFVSAAYRSFDMFYESIEYVKGIKLYRFALGADQFLSGDICAKNKGFCVSGGSNKCLTSGLINVRRCTPQHAPIIFSLPHFLFGNKTLIDSVEGLLPTIQKHGTFVDVEPHTGIVMRGHKRSQLNVAVPKITGISAFEETHNVYLPVLTGDLHSTISDDDADDFKFEVLLPLRLAYAAPFVFIGIGIIAFFFASVLFYRRYDKKRKQAAKQERLGEEVLLLSSTSMNCDFMKRYGLFDD